MDMHLLPLIAHENNASENAHMSIQIFCIKISSIAH